MMHGESRQIWQHSIPGVEQRRYSITFRTTRQKMLGWGILEGV
jgi:alkylated DNA repair dioxygenase AlkB